MSVCRLASVKKGPRNLSLKFGPNWATNSWDIYFFGIELSWGWAWQFLFFIPNLRKLGVHWSPFSWSLISWLWSSLWPWSTATTWRGASSPPPGLWATVWVQWLSAFMHIRGRLGSITFLHSGISKSLHICMIQLSSQISQLCRSCPWCSSPTWPGWPAGVC